MSYFMTYHHSNGPIIQGIVTICIKERWLKYARRKIYIVCIRIVIRINGWWRHKPFRAIHRLADLVHVVLVCKMPGVL